MGRYASFRINGSTTLDFGRKLINQLACRRCHVIDGKGERRAANLDLLLANNDVSQIDAAISKPAFAMPDFRLDSSQRGMIITALFAGGSKNPQYSPERPLVVHFTPSAPKKKDPFTTHCGSCHKILTARGEVLGKGDIGPNLSALLSLNYPQNFPQGRSWTEERLLRWLTNPRAVRTNATMQPRRLSPEELRQLFILLDSQQQNN
jgi:cytochrome c2